tara:strand:+ start:141 stop:398 length:258 start_codon:yes stop_codon:yes gene_type:complete
MKKNNIFNVKNIIEDKNLTFINNYPIFIKKYLYNLFHEKEINIILQKFQNDRNFNFINNILNYNNNQIVIKKPLIADNKKIYFCC